jgi:hypothetical protein
MGIQRSTDVSLTLLTGALLSPGLGILCGISVPRCRQALWPKFSSAESLAQAEQFVCIRLVRAERQNPIFFLSAAELSKGHGRSLLVSVDEKHIAPLTG